MNKELNKWQFVFNWQPDWARGGRGWRELTIGFLKLKSLPREGYMISKEDYKGFLIRAYIFIPIIIE